MWPWKLHSRDAKSWLESVFEEYWRKQQKTPCSNTGGVNPICAATWHRLLRVSAGQRAPGLPAGLSPTLPACFCPGQRVIPSSVSGDPPVTPKLTHHPLSRRLKAHRSSGLCSCAAVCRNARKSWSHIPYDRTSREREPGALLLLQGWFPCALSSFISMSQQHKWRAVVQVIALVHLNHLP